MCLSAPASFGLGAALLPAGAYCVRAAVRKDRRYLPLALAPLLFGVQQGCEGLVWMARDRDDVKLARAAALGFLFFALSFWPFWLPLSAWCLEKRPGMRPGLAVVTLLGLAWSGVLYVPLLVHPERLGIEVVHHSIQYEYGSLPVFQVASAEVLRVAYLLLVVLPLIACPDRRVKWFGILLAAAAVVSQLVFVYAFASVWCFFAAVLAVYLCLVFWQLPPGQSEPARAAPHDSGSGSST
jgi:hypothetical protein